MKHYIVTIAREYGSGGRLIGRRLAQELNIPFYDKELITLAAQESGFAEDFIEKIEQKRRVNFLDNLYMTGQELPVAEQVFLTQSQVIRKIAEKESCVIVGRCADYVLRDFVNCLRVFVHAPLEWRIKCVRDEYHETASNFEDYLRKQDKNRAGYYNYFTQNKWGKAQNYHLSIDSSIGISAVARVLKEMVLAFAEGER
ncbi:MAG: cytidylate kinase-like family protein [Firmicutes bacterium]|nr:cytidylate kinase-like family protein [Bacillota bacterium]